MNVLSLKKSEHSVSGTTEREKPSWSRRSLTAVVTQQKGGQNKLS